MRKAPANISVAGRESRRELPRKAVAFAALLLAAGFSCIVAGLALGAQGTANATALFVLGALMFTPVRRLGSPSGRVAERL